MPCTRRDGLPHHHGCAVQPCTGQTCDSGSIALHQQTSDIATPVVRCPAAADERLCRNAPASQPLVRPDCNAQCYTLKSSASGDQRPPTQGGCRKRETVPSPLRTRGDVTERPREAFHHADHAWPAHRRRGLHCSHSTGVSHLIFADRSGCAAPRSCGSGPCSAMTSSMGTWLAMRAGRLPEPEDMNRASPAWRPPPPPRLGRPPPSPPPPPPPSPSAGDSSGGIWEGNAAGGGRGGVVAVARAGVARRRSGRRAPLPRSPKASLPSGRAAGTLAGAAAAQSSHGQP